MLGYTLRKSQDTFPDLATSKLLNENTFYPAFLKDLNKCGSEVLIESPFITNRRLNMLLPTLEKLKSRKVRVVINTCDPEEHDDDFMRDDGRRAIASLQRRGIHVLYTGGHHRKLAIIDRHTLYEGSLNVLSQNNSREVMRRTESVQLAWQMVRFIEIDKFLG
jgi:phosphatidylserine/phosphatidylglycerophosphate/cardiolipin synthase-like enzyme